MADETERSESEAAQRRRVANRIGGLALHAKGNSREITAPARRAFLARFEQEVDPDGILEPEERARRAGHAKRAYFQRLALRSAKARSRSKLTQPRQGLR